MLVDKKTYNYAIAVDVNKKPMGTLLEAAQSNGMKTGLVVTDAVAGATPGSFSSHAVDRNSFEFIAKQQVDKKVDVIFGGGSQYYTNRKDGINLFDYAKTLGYQVVTNLQDFRGELRTPVIAIFAPDRMSFEIDRDPTTQPSLSEMAKKALDLLSSPNGFFLLVEGSNVDVAGHQNDAASNFRDALAYDETIQVVLQNVNKNTLVVSTADHETGGLTLGTNVDIYNQKLLLNITASSNKMATLINGGQSAASVLHQYIGFTFTDQQIQAIQNSSSNVGQCTILIGQTVASLVGVGWSTTGHTGVDVNLYASGYRANELLGNYNNIEVGNFVASVFGLDLAAETAKLSNFNPAG